MIRRSALAMLAVAVFATSEAHAAVTEVASLPGGVELRLAGPVLAGPGQVAFGWVGHDQSVHVRLAGAPTDVWSAAPPPPPPPTSPDDHSRRTVGQSVVVAAGGGRLAAARSASLSIEPECLFTSPRCLMPSLPPLSYLGELAAGPPPGPLARHSGYGPGCAPGLRDITSLAASGHALAVLETSTRCTQNPVTPTHRLVVLSPGRHVVMVTSPTLAAAAIAGRWVAWLDGARLRLTIADRVTHRVHERLSLPVSTLSGSGSVRLALQSDGRAAVILPGRDRGGPCSPPSTLAWTSPREPRLHRVATGLPVGSGLALADGRALVEVARANPPTGCLEPGSFVAVRLRDGAPLRLASLGESEFAPGGLAWDGHRAAFAVVAPAGTGPDGEPAYRTSIRIADAR